MNLPAKRPPFVAAIIMVVSMMIVPPTITPVSYGQERDVGSGVITFPAAADAYVDKSEPAANFGSEDHMEADEDGPTQAWMLFDVAGVDGKVERATLRLWVANGTEDAPELWYSPNTIWNEDELTWETRPAVDLLVANHAAVEEGSWLEYDVTNAVREDGLYTFALIPEDNDGIDVRTREAEENSPELVVEISPGETPATPAADDDVAILLAAGDISTCDWEEDESTARILDEQPGTIAALGDNVQRDGLLEEFTDCYDPTWGRHKDRTKPTPGNHEYHTPDAEPYFEYFGEAAGTPGEGYYSYTLGEWQVIVLNSNIDMEAGSPQEVWLREELQASDATCTVAYFHHSRFSSGTGHGGSSRVGPVWDALYEHGAELVLNGHEHVYERFAPQNPDGEEDLEHGIRQITVSTGGARFRRIGEIERNSEVRGTEAHGVLRVTLHPDRYEWQFLAIDGQVFSDSGSTECHGAPVEDSSTGTAETQAAVVPVAARRAAGRSWPGLSVR
jgi:acid phosphatase type 7